MLRPYKTMMNLLFLLTSLPLTIAFACFLTASMRLPSIPARAIALFILSFANIVLVAQIAGLVYQLSQHAFWIGIQVILAVAAGLIWRQMGKLPLRLLPMPVGIRQSVKQYPALWLLVMGVTAAYLMAVVLILIVPPNNWDGMAYRLPRVGYWLQHDSLYPWQTENPSQTSYPVNAEIAVLWTFLIRGNDQFAGFVQWSSALALVIVVYGLARLLEFSRAQSLYAAFIFATLPMVFVQSSSVQNDLVVTVFFAISVYFLYLGLKTRHYPSLVLAGVALGLAVGTKTTVLLILPGLAAAVLVIWLKQPSRSFRLLLLWSIACLIGLVIFGSSVYVTNVVLYRNLFGPEWFVNMHTIPADARFEALAVNMSRYLYQWIDFSGLPYIVSKPLIEIKGQLFSVLFENTAVIEGWFEETALRFWRWPHEDLAWFGPIGFLILMPGLLIGVLKWRDPYRLGLILMAMSFLLLHSASQPWEPFKGRYYVLMVGVTAPFMAWAYSPRWRIMRWSSILLALVVLAGTVGFNPRKPTFGSNAIWDKSPIERRTLTSEDQALIIHAVETLVPNNATLGIAFTREWVWVFPFFGAQMERTLIPLDTSKPFTTLEELAHVGVTFLVGEAPLLYSQVIPNYLLVNNSLLNHITDTSGYELLIHAEKLSLFRRIQS